MTSSSEKAGMPPRVFNFAKFNVTTAVFHVTPRSFAFVNIKPLLPGHILVCPQRMKPNLSDLESEEISDLFNTVTLVQKTLKRVYKADAFNVAVQDGEAAGQSVPHVHVHVIPRTRGDPAGDDKIHEWLEGEGGDVGAHQREAEERRKQAQNGQQWARDEDRKPRGEEEMQREAKWLEEEMKKDAMDDGKL